MQRVGLPQKILFRAQIIWEQFEGRSAQVVNSEPEMPTPDFAAAFEDTLETSCFDVTPR